MLIRFSTTGTGTEPLGRALSSSSHSVPTLQATATVNLLSSELQHAGVRGVCPASNSNEQLSNSRYEQPMAAYTS